MHIEGDVSKGDYYKFTLVSPLCYFNSLWVTLYLGIVPEILSFAEQRTRAGQSGNQLFKDRF